MGTTSKNNNRVDYMSSRLFNKLRKNNPVLFGQYSGWLFRSTMSTQKKISLLENFLARGDLTELPSLIQTLKDSYNVADIPRRNREWKEYHSF